MRHSRTTCLLATLTPLAATSVASAQTSSPPLPVKLGQIVWVTTSEGLDMKGFVSAITPTTLEVRGEAGTRQFVVAETRRIAKRDGNRNGFLIGAESHWRRPAARSWVSRSGVGVRASIRR